jgi:phage terminase large subunit GpA-like protein
MDAFLHYHTVIVVGPVQVGKSICGVDVPWAWFEDQIGGRALLVYADKDTVNDIFEEKLKPIIENNLKHLWSGRENDIRQEKIILRSGISRCASCNVKNDLATFPAKFVLLDEVAKWKTGTRASFDAVGQAIGRTRDYHGAPGIDYRVSIVSSPVEVGDALYAQVYQPGTLILKRKVPCLGCGFFHELCVENIHEIPNSEGKKDHDPHRIRSENAADYVCPACGKIIEDSERYEMDRLGVWAADDEIVVDGEIQNNNLLRDKTDRVCYWIPGRLVSRPEKYSFADCLSGYFQNKFSPDANAWQNYLNEDMARFFKPQVNRLTEGYFRGKIAKDGGEYTTTGEIPDGVLVALGGVDTQDTGFYYSIVGYGRYMECWILRFGWIPCDMNMSDFKDPQKVLLRFEQEYFKTPLKYKDGRTLPVIMTMIDEGGHREKQIRYICQRHRDIAPYKGVGRDMPLFKKSETKKLYLCNAESLSKLVEKDMASDTWHLPVDVTQDYLDQIQKQYTTEVRDKNGNPKYEWVHGGEDHYRDTLNMALGAAHVMNLPGRLNNESGIKQIMNTVAHKTAERELEPEKVESNLPHRYHNPTINKNQMPSPFHSRPRLWGARR